MAVVFDVKIKSLDDKSGNLILTGEIYDEATPAIKLLNQTINGTSLTNAKIQSWAADRYAEFLAGNAAKAATVNQGDKLPIGTVIDPVKIARLKAAVKAEDRAGRIARAAVTGDQAYIDAVAEAIAADDDLNK